MNERFDSASAIVEHLNSRLGCLSRDSICQKSDYRGSGSWDYWGGGHEASKLLPYTCETSLEHMYRVGFELWRFPIIRAMGEHLVSYCVGRGWKYIPQKKTGKSVAKSVLQRIEGAIEEVMDEVDLGQATGWYLLQEETYRRNYRDGQWFRKYGFYEDGRLWVRFIEPMDIRCPSLEQDSTGRQTDPNNITMLSAMINGIKQEIPVVNGKVWRGEFGVVTDFNDACTPIGYWKRRLRQTDEIGKKYDYIFEQVIGKKTGIQSGKSGVDFNDPRGIPAFYDVYCHCKQLEEVINAMVELSITQSSFAAVYTHKAATTADALREIAKKTDKQMQQNNGRPVPGEVIHVKGAELDLPGMNVRATQYVELIQAIQRILGNVYGIPEFMATGDANTGNRSSLTAAEGPFALRVQREQKQQACYDVELMWKAVAKKLDWSASKLASVKSSVRMRAEFPIAAVRDWSKEMSVMLELYKERIISSQQINRRMDIDDEQMVHELNVRESTPPPASAKPEVSNPTAGSRKSAGTPPASSTQANK